MANIKAHGTFDLFHIGHLRVLQRDRELGPGGTRIVGYDEYLRKKFGAYMKLLSEEK